MEESKRPRLNPLSTPWGKKPHVEEKPTVPSFIGVRNEAVRDSANAKNIITVHVRSIKGVPDGEYRLEWVEGTTLKQYLTQVKLVSAAMHAAVRDTTNPSVGRVRMHYIPEPGAHITLGSPSVSSALQFQRSNHDAQNLARRMGGGERIVEMPLGRK